MKTQPSRDTHEHRVLGGIDTSVCSDRHALQLQEQLHQRATATAYEGELVDREKINQMRAQYGLDQPMWKQYLNWVTGLLQGDLGFSFEHNLPVSDVIGDRLHIAPANDL